MARKARIAPGGLVYHVLNRSVGKMKMFRTDKDFLAFERIMMLAMEKHPIRLLSYCLMSTHWHFVVWPGADCELTAFFRWLAHTHAMRWRVSHHTVGYGHLYQGRFKSFPVQQDRHLLTVCRYVERNALSAKIVKRAQDWRWSSQWCRQNGSAEQKALLSDWPVARPKNWIELVNEPWQEKDLAALRDSRERSSPFGEATWRIKTAAELGLSHTMRGEGRPKKVLNEK